jgi:hypothetical protein
MLATPHLAYYDFGILALPVVAAIDASLRRGCLPALPVRVAIGVVYVGYAWFAKSATALGFQPLTLWTVALFAWLCWLGACNAPSHCAYDPTPKRS